MGRDVFGVYDNEITNDLMELIIELRKQAKINKDFSTADQIREGLNSMHVQLKDSREGTTWKYEKE